MDADRCRKPGCHCKPAEGSEYCSASCARVALGDIPPASCECGHDGCRSEPATARATAGAAADRAGSA